MSVGRGYRATVDAQTCRLTGFTTPTVFTSALAARLICAAWPDGFRLSSMNDWPFQALIDWKGGKA